MNENKPGRSCIIPKHRLHRLVYRVTAHSRHRSFHYTEYVLSDVSPMRRCSCFAFTGMHSVQLSPPTLVTACTRGLRNPFFHDPPALRTQGGSPVVDSESRVAPGEMAEWLKAHAWKACIPQGIQGSNPCLSATFTLQPRLHSAHKASNRLPVTRVTAILARSLPHWAASISLMPIASRTIASRTIVA